MAFASARALSGLSSSAARAEGPVRGVQHVDE